MRYKFLTGLLMLSLIARAGEPALEKDKIQELLEAGAAFARAAGEKEYKRQAKKWRAIIAQRVQDTPHLNEDTATWDWFKDQLADNSKVLLAGPEAAPAEKRLEFAQLMRFALERKVRCASLGEYMKTAEAWREWYVRSTPEKDPPATERFTPHDQLPESE